MNDFLMSMESLLEVMKIFGPRQRGWLHKTMNVLKATESHTFKWLVFMLCDYTALRDI